MEITDAASRRTKIRLGNLQRIQCSILCSVVLKVFYLLCLAKANNTAVFRSHNIVYEHDKKAKEMVRKRGGSAKGKAIKFGQEARVFSATIHYNPTYGQLDGAIHIPEGQSIPDVHQFVSQLR